MKCIVFDRPDGSVATRGGLGPRMLVKFKGDRDAALKFILEELVPRQNPDAINPRIEDVQFPPDRDFRNAWKSVPGMIEVDMPKAREIWRDHLRRLRAPLLAALDAEYLRADERGDLVAKAEIAAKKQALRDVTADPAIEVAVTPEELKAVIPAALR